MYELTISVTVVTYKNLKILKKSYILYLQCSVLN